MLNPNENGNFLKLYNYIFNNHCSSAAIYTLFFKNGNILEATVDTIYESDNDLELDDPDYEEFESIVFCNKATGTLFEVTYHNLPASVLCNGEKVY